METEQGNTTELTEKVLLLKSLLLENEMEVKEASSLRSENTKLRKRNEQLMRNIERQEKSIEALIAQRTFLLRSSDRSNHNTTPIDTNQSQNELVESLQAQIRDISNRLQTVTQHLTSTNDEGTDESGLLAQLANFRSQLNKQKTHLTWYRNRTAELEQEVGNLQQNPRSADVEFDIRECIASTSAKLRDIIHAKNKSTHIKLNETLDVLFATLKNTTDTMGVTLLGEMQSIKTCLIKLHKELPSQNQASSSSPSKQHNRDISTESVHDVSSPLPSKQEISTTLMDIVDEEINVTVQATSEFVRPMPVTRGSSVFASASKRHSTDLDNSLSSAAEVTENFQQKKKTTNKKTKKNETPFEIIPHESPSALTLPKTALTTLMDIVDEQIQSAVESSQFSLQKKRISKKRATKMDKTPCEIIPQNDISVSSLPKVPLTTLMDIVDEQSQPLESADESSMPVTRASGIKKKTLELDSSFSSLPVVETNNILANQRAEVSLFKKRVSKKNTAAMDVAAPIEAVISTTESTAGTSSAFSPPPKSSTTTLMADKEAENTSLTQIMDGCVSPKPVLTSASVDLDSSFSASPIAESSHMYKKRVVKSRATVKSQEAPTNSKRASKGTPKKAAVTTDSQQNTFDEVFNSVILSEDSQLAGDVVEASVNDNVLQKHPPEAGEAGGDLLCQFSQDLFATSHEDEEMEVEQPLEDSSLKKMTVKETPSNVVVASQLKSNDLSISEKVSRLAMIAKSKSLAKKVEQTPQPKEQSPSRQATRPCKFAPSRRGESLSGTLAIVEAVRPLQNVVAIQLFQRQKELLDIFFGSHTRITGGEMKPKNSRKRLISRNTSLEAVIPKKKGCVRKVESPGEKAFVAELTKALKEPAMLLSQSLSVEFTSSYDEADWLNIYQKLVLVWVQATPTILVNQLAAHLSQLNNNRHNRFIFLSRNEEILMHFMNLLLPGPPTAVQAMQLYVKSIQLSSGSKQDHLFFLYRLFFFLLSREQSFPQSLLLEVFIQSSLKNYLLDSVLALAAVSRERLSSLLEAGNNYLGFHLSSQKPNHINKRYKHMYNQLLQWVPGIGKVHTTFSSTNVVQTFLNTFVDNETVVWNLALHCTSVECNVMVLECLLPTMEAHLAHLVDLTAEQMSNLCTLLRCFWQIFLCKSPKPQSRFVLKTFRDIFKQLLQFLGLEEGVADSAKPAVDILPHVLDLLMDLGPVEPELWLKSICPHGDGEATKVRLEKMGLPPAFLHCFVEKLKIFLTNTL